MNGFFETNEFHFLVEVLICMSGTVLAYKLFGKTGLYAWIALSTVAANVTLAKQVDIFGMSLTLGNVVYSTSFLSTDILSEKYGGKYARKGVIIGLLISIFFSLITYEALQYTPNEYDYINDQMTAVLGQQVAVVICSLVSYFVSNTLDTYTYDLLRKWFPKHLWIRNNGSTMTSQFVDSFMCIGLFVLIGVFEPSQFLELSLTAWLLKVVVAACDTPFIYIAKKLKPISE